MRPSHLAAPHLAAPREAQDIRDRLPPLLLDIPHHGGRGPADLERPLDKVGEEMQPLHAALVRDPEIAPLLLGPLVLVAPAPLVLGLGLGLTPDVGVADVDPGEVLARRAGRRGKPGEEGVDGLGELPGVGAALVRVVDMSEVGGFLLRRLGEDGGGFTVLPPFFGVELLDSACELGCDLLVACPRRV